MINRREILGLAIVGLPLTLGGCGVIFPTRYRYRMTIEVETPEGLKTGSVVHEIKAHEVPIKLADGDKGYVGFRGEAAAVDLPGGQTLFALVSSSNPGEESLIPAVQSAFDPHYERGAAGNLATARKMSDAPDGTTAVLKPTNSFEGGDKPFYPLLVRFRDINDPATVEQVNPDEFSQIFGSGYMLRKITVTITRDSITRSLKDRLNWLDQALGYADRYFIGKFRKSPSIPIGKLDELIRSDLTRDYK